MFRGVLSLLTILFLSQFAATGADSAPADWPTRPIAVIIPGPAGSATDIIARIVTREMSKRLGQPIVIENRPGGEGTIGTRAAARAAPDGYTFTIGANNSYAGAVISHGASLDYDPVKDFEPVSLVGRAPYLLAVYPGLGVSSVEDLVRLAKSKPGALNYAAIGEASVSRYGMLLFEQTKGIELKYIPYKSTAQSIVDLASGVIQLQLATIPPTLALMQNGTVKALAVTSAKRIPRLPDMPTMQEAGVANYDVAFWLAMFAPAKTPRPIIDKVNAALRASLDVPEVQAALAVQGFEGQATSPEGMADILRKDIDNFHAAFARAGFKPGEDKPQSR